jgi:hypothetical protein
MLTRDTHAVMGLGMRITFLATFVKIYIEMQTVV